VVLVLLQLLVALDYQTLFLVLLFFMLVVVLVGMDTKEAQLLPLLVVTVAVALAE
jgi:hypothetical protein